MRVDRVSTGAHALAAARCFEYDSILLDPALPDIGGAHVIRELRAITASTPVIVLTAQTQIDFRITLLDSGADDCLGKPVDPVELCARMRAMRRRGAANSDACDDQCIGPLAMSQASRTVRWNGHPVTLQRKEFDLLETLLVRRPRVLSSSELEHSLYGWSEGIEGN